ncbi:EAL domain-containing protein (putative c-di-GMP-specific phosphodiesterase class I) [Bacillus sp. SLBN-46]|uniref:EAL domain-containing protein n=1 Tax=Bacillus sp. SLBN-46 TaxID=3042283 RepID=UPI0028675F7D|nr:EAL domain-containing protein [Bacillus sp. SLBN-46]MDR6121196.1 EAL domain-containing protein (putative c-di-GMP-specific phosphodiesterase class I) [Bacillus sp. SLBN-46]
MSGREINQLPLVKMEHVYQPMWNVTNMSLFGYEALLRFPDGFFEGNIETCFERAREAGILYELDTKSILGAAGSFPLHQLNEERLFINIYPSTLLHPGFEAFIDQFLLSFPHAYGKIVFELSETKFEDDIWEIKELKERVKHLKEKGFLIALDDIGKGAAELQKMIEFTPDYIKLDRYFAKELADSEEKQEMIALFIQYSKGKMGVILEGIEQGLDLEQAKRLHVPVAQGYLLGKPQKITNQRFIRDFSA